MSEDLNYEFNLVFDDLPQGEIFRVSFPTKFKWWQLIKKWERYKKHKFLKKMRISIDGKNFYNIL